LQYSAKFIPDLASIARPIQDLTKKHVEFVWGKKQQHALDKLKSLMAKPDVLAYFRNDCQTRVVTDASPTGLGAVLTQGQNSIWRVIAYASRSLSDVERRYSQTKKEALAIVWAVERFNFYLFGMQFELESAHKPLECIYGCKSKPSARIVRWVLRLQGYNFTVVYRAGKTNIADMLSRLNLKVNRDYSEKYYYVAALVGRSTIPALRSDEIDVASKNDPELVELRQCIQTGNWANCSCKKYLPVRQELCNYGNLLLRGTGIIIPKELRKRVLELAHKGHQGIVKTKSMLRVKVWWPGMDKEGERLCRTCHGCQVNSEFNRPEPITTTLPPSGPWQDCAIDILGPLPTGENFCNR